MPDEFLLLKLILTCLACFAPTQLSLLASKCAWFQVPNASSNRILPYGLGLNFAMLDFEAEPSVELLGELLSARKTMWS